MIKKIVKTDIVIEPTKDLKLSENYSIKTFFLGIKIYDYQFNLSQKLEKTETKIGYK